MNIIAKIFTKVKPLIFILRLLSAFFPGLLETDKCEQVFWERVKIDVVEFERRVERQSTETVTGFHCVSHGTKISLGDAPWSRPSQ
ncbi:hypothetical protein [Xanthobacter oligotrophicus]|uniref:hypothetical protein n=1 Tax=Xanthobacter oligotrophicus TaxID=2607286 RepID=UPI0011F0C3FE|nr:hypothetical protein [Xanthobacter oligotrophicus]MCG5236457.1 hypothetical protein [Xanthobacter oligotrophicus]